LGDLEIFPLHRSNKMNVLCTSDWHMGIYGDPSDALKLNNSQLLDLLSRWEAQYDLILFNGDILEVLKSARVKFSHIEQAQRVIEDRLPVIEKIMSLKNYRWIVGNHDYPLEQLLGLPQSLTIHLENDYTLIAEHGHLLRAPIEHYSQYAWHFHLMYCLGWWVDRIGMKLSGEQFCLDTKIAQSLNEWRLSNANRNLYEKIKDRMIRLAISYASLNSDVNYASLDDLFLNKAQELFGKSKTLVTFGHSHHHKTKYFDNNNVYVNTGHFSQHNGYSTSIFSTDEGKITLIKNQ
jgi:UDP-2,3-diacylglucosamine pyrophosphatase LpxH